MFCKCVGLGTYYLIGKVSRDAFVTPRDFERLDWEIFLQNRWFNNAWIFKYIKILHALSKT